MDKWSLIEDEAVGRNLLNELLRVEKSTRTPAEWKKYYERKGKS